MSSLARAGLAGIALGYRAGIALRNTHYDRPHASHPARVPVISIGNITAGGTGKTPVVIDIARRLDRMGRSVAVLARGYGAPGGETNDEQQLVQRHCPGVVCVCDRDRVRGAAEASDRLGADVIVLDDGFQHRRLGRDLDIVLVDATLPFGHGFLLPRGLLREPLSNLGRADVVVISRCDQVAPTALARIDARVRSVAPKADHLRCKHVVTGIERLDGRAMETPFEGKRAVLVAGIGNPSAFAATVGAMGVAVVAHRWFGDHHAYSRRDVDALLASDAFPPYDLLLTTEKDAIKIAQLARLDHVNVGVVRVAVEFVDDGGAIMQRRLERVLAEHADR